MVSKSGSGCVKKNSFVIALAGQPNTGKSTVFNVLTGARQHVGNWPGKTVEQKIGEFLYDNNSYSLIDLPGTYSLSANSTEEVIARNFIIHKKPDLIVVVVDASQLSRSLYLAAEIIHLGMPVIIALNMMDVAQKKGMTIDCNALQKSLGVGIVSMVASKKTGVQKLLGFIEDTVFEKWSYPEQQFVLEEKYSVVIQKIQKKIYQYVPKDYRTEWVAFKMLEGDSDIVHLIQNRMDAKEWQSIALILPDKKQGALAVGKARYFWIDTVFKNAVSHKKKLSTNHAGQNGFDRIATHPVSGSLLGIVIVILGLFVTGLIGYMALQVLAPLLWLIPYLQHTIGSSFPIIADFFTQAIIPGVYMIMAVASFNFTLMLFLGFLEDVGYLPRLAYLTDIFMTKIGLHGKSFVPLLLGLGCNIAAVMGCRIIETARQRVKAIIIASHVPCPGVMVTTAFMVGVFFGPAAPLVIAAMVAAVIIQVYITAKLLDYTFLRGVHTGMVMELPPYHLPNWRTIGNYVWQNYKGFLQKAGTLIAAVTTVIWVFSYFPNGRMADSYLAFAGKIFEPLGRLVGMDWKLLTCLFVASLSKEAALISMAVIFGVQVADGALTSFIVNSSGSIAFEHKELLENTLLDVISKPSALAFIFAVLFSMPCFATLGAIYYETKSLKWTIGSLAYYTLLSFSWAFIIYHISLSIF